MNHEITSEHNHAAAPAEIASSALHRASEQAAAFAQRGTDAMHRSADALHRGSEELQSKARQLSHGTTAYIHREPAKAMLIAAATGATLMALLGLLARLRGVR